MISVRIEYRVWSEYQRAIQEICQICQSDLRVLSGCRLIVVKASLQLARSSYVLDIRMNFASMTTDIVVHELSIHLGYSSREWDWMKSLLNARNQVYITERAREWMSKNVAKHLNERTPPCSMCRWRSGRWSDIAQPHPYPYITTHHTESSLVSSSLKAWSCCIRIRGFTRVRFMLGRWAFILPPSLSPLLDRHVIQDAIKFPQIS